MKLKRKFREIRKNPVYVKSGIFLLLSLLLFLCVYIQDNSRSILTDEKGQEIVKRSDDAGKKENLELKVKAGDLEESVNITVSGRAYDSVELEEKFKEAAENLEKIILGDNENPDEVRTDLNLVTEIPDTGISVTWELDNYDVMDIRGGLRQENLTEEGTLVKMQLEELMGTTKMDQKLIFKDYSKRNVDILEFKKKIKNFSSEELLDLTNMAKLLGHSGFSENMDIAIKSRGYRILSKIHRLPSTIIENLVNYFDNFQEILNASIEELDDVEGIGEIRATYIKNGLIKMKQLVLLDRHI